MKRIFATALALILLFPSSSPAQSAEVMSFSSGGYHGMAITLDQDISWIHGITLEAGSGILNGSDLLAGNPINVSISSSAQFLHSPNSAESWTQASCQLVFSAFANNQRNAQLGSVPVSTTISYREDTFNLYNGNIPYISFSGSGRISAIPNDVVANTLVYIQADFKCNGSDVLDPSAYIPVAGKHGYRDLVEVGAVPLFNRPAELVQDPSTGKYYGYVEADWWYGSNSTDVPEFEYWVFTCPRPFTSTATNLLDADCTIVGSWVSFKPYLVSEPYSIPKRDQIQYGGVIAKAKNRFGFGYSRSASLLISALPKSSGSAKYANIRYSNCTALNRKFSGGIRKYATTINKGGKVTRTPYTSKVGYLKNSRLDRDKDGIACEK